MSEGNYRAGKKIEELRGKRGVKPTLFRKVFGR